MNEHNPDTAAYVARIKELEAERDRLTEQIQIQASTIRGLKSVSEILKGENADYRRRLMRLGDLLGACRDALGG
jgi:cell shape-determining protein MreC